ncbi:MAG: CDP-diacylglycerol--glycerol-3-phosphate 3-phosphatidyltransferase [Erysipelotrichales bacterium]|nr:CDP-diacylglycerol--glycerol-3-phosphate 3-phosphatidyltransferase [Erysipelotrichales bacterium]
MNLPNKITTFRMVLVVALIAVLLLPFEYGYVFGSSVLTWQYLVAFIIFFVASVSDFFDGYIARKYNLVTTFGKFMDPIADKLLVNSAFIILAIQGPYRIPAIVVVIMIGRDIIVDALRMISVQKGIVIAASKLGKLKTVTQMVALSFVFLADWPFSLLGTKGWVGISLCYLAALVSLVSGIDYVIKGRKVFKDE